MGKGNASNIFVFKGDQMAKGKKIGLMKVAIIHPGKISKRNIKIVS